MGQGFFTVLNFKKIIYVYTSFQYYFSKCLLFADCGEFDSTYIDFITGQILYRKQGNRSSLDRIMHLYPNSNPKPLPIYTSPRISLDQSFVSL